MFAPFQGKIKHGMGLKTMFSTVLEWDESIGATPRSWGGHLMPLPTSSSFLGNDLWRIWEFATKIWTSGLSKSLENLEKSWKTWNFLNLPELHPSVWIAHISKGNVWRIRDWWFFGVIYDLNDVIWKDFREKCNPIPLSGAILTLENLEKSWKRRQKIKSSKIGYKRWKCTYKQR